MKWYWLSTDRMTVAVACDEEDMIVEAAPIVRRFVGQPAANLGRWLRKQGGFRAEKLHECTCAKGRRCLNCIERDGLTKS